MKKYLFIICVFGCLVFVKAQTESKLFPSGGLYLPEGFQAEVIAEKLGRGRHLAVRENGDIYLALRSPLGGFGIAALRDTDHNGQYDQKEYFGHTHGTGIDIYAGYIYYSNDTAVFRQKLAESLVPESPVETVIRGFPQQSQHADKPFTFDNEGHIYVNVGAPSNACMEQMRTAGSPGLDPCPQLIAQAGIWRFSLDDIPTEASKGYRYASGIRNSIALDWNKNLNELYVVQHGRDQLHQFFPEIYDEDAGVYLPAEEFLLVNEGNDFGWPYCYYDGLKKLKVLAPEYGGDGEKTGRCAAMDDPIMAFPAHAAPNDLCFYTAKQFPKKYRNGAFICFHGSWNRAPQQQEGYYVVFVPFEGLLPSGPFEIFADGFSGKEVVMSPYDATYRPMGLAIGPDGSLFISDSREGKIWKISYIE